MKVELRKSVIKDFKKIPSKEKQQILNALISLELYPRVSNIKKLVNFDYAFRMRTGNYRILFDLVNETIFVSRILKRKDAYR
ncbi:MAG: type II toxin-antitoxin system RelE/ParE family toxin [Ignavibacteriales bacterium]|nr:type II toxin-antitoxin system RelE/ParE family toxin [Ignavibacteriales bacterium]